jgi:hypothetical protein
LAEALNWTDPPGKVFIDQLPDDIQESIPGIIGTLIFFRIGAADAKELVQDFFPVFTETDLIILPRFHIYLKLLSDGTTSQPSGAATIKKSNSLF